VKRCITFMPMMALFFFSASLSFSENSSNQIVIYRLKEGGIKEIRDHFSTGDKIYAKFTFLPKEKETSVEYRWITPLNNIERFNSELVRAPITPSKQTVLCWLYLPSSLPDRVVGSKYFGRWILEVWVNNHRAATKVFDVGN
jgi:hypothetical protein